MSTTCLSWVHILVVVPWNQVLKGWGEVDVDVEGGGLGKGWEMVGVGKPDEHMPHMHIGFSHSNSPLCPPFFPHHPLTFLKQVPSSPLPPPDTIPFNQGTMTHTSSNPFSQGEQMVPPSLPLHWAFTPTQQGRWEDIGTAHNPSGTVSGSSAHWSREGEGVGSWDGDPVGEWCGVGPYRIQI